VASVTQQSIGKEFHSLGLSTENVRRPRVQTVRRHDELVSPMIAELLSSLQK